MVERPSIHQRNWSFDQFRILIDGAVSHIAAAKFRNRSRHGVDMPLTSAPHSLETPNVKRARNRRLISRRREGCFHTLLFLLALAELRLATRNPAG